MAEQAKSTRGRRQVLTDSTRKRKGNETTSKWNKTRINIGEEFERWNALRDAIKAKSHGETARFLLDHYKATHPAVYEHKDPNPFIGSVGDSPNQNQVKIQGEVPVASTPVVQTNIPVKSPGNISMIQGSDTSEVESDIAMSGVEELEVRASSSVQCTGDTKPRSFIDPFSVDIDITMPEHDTGNEDSDEDYNPSVNITIRSEGDISEVESDLDCEDATDDTDVELPEMYEGPGIVRVKSVDSIDQIMNNRPYLVFHDQLISLAKTNQCSNSHKVYTWCSQPLMKRRLHAGDILFAASVLLSGNNFQKIALFAKFLQLPVLSSSTFHKLQRTYFIPAIDTAWVKHQDDILAEFQGQNLVVLGDGRMGSPGHSAQYCSYTFMENTTKKILCIITMDKRATDKKSTNLEKACFLKECDSYYKKD